MGFGSGFRNSKKPFIYLKEEARIEHTNKMINNAFENGKKEGQQEVWKAVSKFLKERMLAHFMNKNNEIAKELRDINEIISKNIT